jgi:hypothetical protein
MMVMQYVHTKQGVAYIRAATCAVIPCKQSEAVLF